MAQFPKAEADVVALANAMIAGYIAHPASRFIRRRRNQVSSIEYPVVPSSLLLHDNFCCYLLPRAENTLKQGSFEFLKETNLIL